MDSTLGNFEWLADLQKSQSFTTYELTNSAKSTDLGYDGYTASLTDWNELLQLTAPDATCGLVFVRGHFPNTPDAILARAQRRDHAGNKGTFGTQLAPAVADSDLELGERRHHGLVNFRWPYSQYELKRKDGNWDGNHGTYEEIFFVKDRTVIQITRIKWGSGSSLSDYDSADAQEKMTVTFKSGGLLQFGCPCSNGGPPTKDIFQLNSFEGETRLSCTSEHYQKTLDLRLFVNDIAQDMGHPALQGLGDEINDTEVDTSASHSIELLVGEPTTIISSYSLRDINEGDVSIDKDFFGGIDDYLGICSTSLNMTDRLYTALCSTNYESSEALEFCVIGRCVEQILCVASMPIPPSVDNRRPIDLDNDNISIDTDFFDGTTVETAPSHSEIALLCNIMGPQHVDVRLLAKVHHFISTRHLEPDLLDGICSLDRMREAYLVKLRDHMTLALTWLVNTDLRPGRLLLALSSNDTQNSAFESTARLHQCEGNRVMMDFDRSYNQACFATLSIWYVMKHCPEAITDEFKSQVLLPKLNKAYESVQKRASRDKEPTQKNDVLQWFHLSCLVLVCNQSFGKFEDGRDKDGFTASGLDRQDVLKAQQKFEKYVARLKPSYSDTYSITNEELDRLVLLGEELGLEGLGTDYTASLSLARAAQTRARILDRKRTTRLNPGPGAWKSTRITSNGPWELSCLNHSSLLRVTDESNIKVSRDRLFEFMSSNFSFMNSWDRADSDMVGKWWDLEPTAVVCATLLDLKLETKLKAARSEAAAEDLNRSIHDPLNLDVAQGETMTSAEEPFQEESIRDILLQIKQANDQANRNHLVQMRQLMAQDDMGVSLSARSFNWMACKPDQLFHPTEWVQSLQDSPEVYTAKQTKDVPLRKDVRRYLYSRDCLDVIRDPEYTLANIEAKVPAEDVQFLSIFDLSLKRDFTFSLKELFIDQTNSSALPSARTVNGRRGTVNNRPKSPTSKQASDSYSSNQLEAYRKQLFINLNDSLVDLGTKHRILFVEKCTPSIVGSMIYMWHTQALDTFDSYFSSSSRFFEAREATLWTTSITVSHWSIRPTSLSKDHHQRFNENRSNGDFPPRNIGLLGRAHAHHKKVEPFQPADIVEERSSSLVLTGDPSGYQWICSIWSSLTNAEFISTPIKSLPSVLQQFIHQQACGRCLAFLILLGHLCEKLSGEYDLILSRLDIIVGLGEKVLLEGLEWGTSEAVDKLKKMLWGLEALRVFDDRLSASLSQISLAKEAMERIIKQEAGQPHVDLLQEYNNVLEEFQKRFGLLSDVQVRTQLKIRQVTGLRDGISTVTNVEDSQTALRDSKTTIKQGNNIRILTYITIAYLPLGFVTGLFSMNTGTFMDHANNVLYAVLIVIFVLGTYTLALSLENILEQWSRLKKQTWGRDRKRNDGIGEEKDGSAVEDTLSRQSTKISLGKLGGWVGLRRVRRPPAEVNGEEKISRAA